MIRAARPIEASALTELALRSKAVWGYSTAFMEACKAEMALQPSSINDEHSQHWLIESNGAIAGFYVLEWLDGGDCELDALYVDPAFLRQGLGKRLLSHAKQRASDRGVKRLLIQSDPNAEAFYLAAGAKKIGERESGSISNRYLPLLALPLF